MIETLTRRRFAALGGAAVVGAALPVRRARAADFTLKWGTNVPASHPLNVNGMKAAAAISQATDGKIELQLFPNNQLGGDADMFSQLRSGALECFTLSGANVLSTLLPGTAITGVGFAFKDYASVWKALDGDLGAQQRKLIASANLVAFDRIWDNGFRQVTTSTHPVTDPASIKGLKIRVPVSALWSSLFESLGAAPTNINFSEVYSALQTHVVDAQENPPAIIESAKLYEVQKYCSLTNHMWDGWWFLVNGDIWNTIPPDMQDIVRREVNKACLDERHDIVDQTEGMKRQLASQGLVFNPVDEAPFREALAKSGYYAKWKKTFGPDEWRLLEEVTGALT